MRRRTLLRAGAAAVATPSAGCLSSVVPEALVSGEARLRRVTLRNGDSNASHAVALVVERDGEGVHEAVYDLDASGGERDAVTVQDDWPGDPGRYVVRVRVDDGDWEAVAYDEAGCVAVAGYVTWNGGVQFDETRSERC